MQIECTIRREGGSRVTIGEEEYLFAPSEHGPHLCEVSRQEHVAIFLGIPEAYRLSEQDLATEDDDSDSSLAQSSGKRRGRPPKTDRPKIEDDLQ